ncbi:hypothetical protein DFH29DRAFT_1075375 [Suillus ampliporus]|nr:hypothetical protein DFH29DRAFT_1075375 [Suillus ampliporus]
MPTSEIDDIFAAKGKAKAVELVVPLPSVKEKKSQSPLKKRPLPETVVDPSLKSSTSSKRPKMDASSHHEKTSHETRKEDEDRFKDSRGSGPRRKTDDGYNIYKEDELGISNNAGGMLRSAHLLSSAFETSSGSTDTPLCPFDCDCCMFWPVFIFLCDLNTLQVFER